MTTAIANIEAAKQRARNAVEGIADELVRISGEIHSHPELAFKEHHAVGQLVPFVKSHGFDVRTGVYGMETAFRGEWGHGPVTIAVCAEYDALPEIGHACGHNLIATAGVGAAVALIEAIDPADARVVILGTPAEEGGGGKIRMINGGCFTDVDVAMMAHPGPVDVVYYLWQGNASVAVEYIGRAAHQGASPERGINALDAIITAYNAMAQLRQHIRRDARLAGIITHGGDAVNIVPERTAGKFSVRAVSMSYLAELKARLQHCLEAGALATGCELKATWSEGGYEPFRHNRPMAEAYISNGAVFSKTFLGRSDASGASTDMANVSQVVPAIHPVFGIGTRAGNHTRDFTAAAVTDAAHAAMIEAAKMLAMTGVDLALDPDLVRRAKADFAER
jgi:amidohydrolase